MLEYFPPEPPEPKVIDKCAACGEYILENDRIFYLFNKAICERCVIESEGE